MNKHIKVYILLLISTVVSLTSCDSFLDRQQDEALTFDKIWEKRNTSYRYFLTAMSYIPLEAEEFNHDPFLAASDEGTVTYNRDFRWINFGSWNPSNVPYERMTKFYQGIREANIFLKNIDRCKDPILTGEEKSNWKAQVKFARTYYYFLMMRIYGPVFILGDEPLDFTQTTQALERPRSTWDECVKYVCDELDALTNDPAIPASWRDENEKGWATKGTCMALKARLLLYSARPLFNGNTTYAELKNPDGAALFPAKDEAKWKKAAEAALAVINLGQYSLYKDGDGSNPIKNLRGLVRTHWNDELIFSSGYRGMYNMGVHTVPTGLSGTAYGGVGPTQQQVDAYAMNNGIYPIIGYDANGSPSIDPSSTYNVDEFGETLFKNPSYLYNTTAVKVRNMYVNREPRFYMHVFYSDGLWEYGTGNTLKINFAKGGNSNKSHDYPKSGYLLNKYYDHSLNSATGNWGNIVYPTIRLGEVYLNFAEAAIECKALGNDEYMTDALTYWNEIRSRAGLDKIQNVYAGIENDVVKLREMIRRERRVELAFENHRYFDTRTWKIAEQTDGGPMYGMKVDAPGSGNTAPPAFWARSVFETRVFKPQHYLYPFSQREIDRNKKLVQNYGW